MLKFERIAVAAASSLCLLCCPGPGARRAVIPADHPIHLEEYMNHAEVGGSEVPKDLEAPVVWRFDKARTDWKTIARPRKSAKPVQPVQMDDALRLILDNRVKTPGGREPLWAKDGRELFCRRFKEVWAADVNEDRGFAAGKPRRLFELAWGYWGRPTRAYDLSPDDRMFLMTKRGVDLPQPSPVTEMALVLNWFEELKRVVPGGK